MAKKDIKKNIAVALRYDKNKDKAPKLIASGKGFIADRIKEEAKKSDIPLHRDEELAVKLSKVAVGQEIPSELYEVVASIFLFIRQLDDRSEKYSNR